MKDYKLVRRPTKKELAQLEEFIAKKLGSEHKDLVTSAYVAVFPNYQTGGPGYTGKLMCVAWDGDPSFYEVYIWDKGKLGQLLQADELRWN